MATLTNTQISVTYVGLLKTSANTVLSSTAQQITDGSGNNSILFLSTAGVGIGGAAASGKELDVTGNVLITGDLQVDNINIDGNTISSTAGTDLNITPLAGQQIVLDGTIVIDAGVVTGATSITSTAFVGALTGDVTGNADTATKISSITNSNIVQLTSSQTLTNKTIDVDNNTVSNIEVDNLKSGVLDTDLSSVSSSDDTLASAKAIKTYVDAQVDTADELSEILAIGNTTGATKISVNNTSSGIDFIDDAKARFGTGNDLSIYHGSSNSYIQNTSGSLIIEQASGAIALRPKTDENGVLIVEDGAVSLYHNNIEKLTTTTNGIYVKQDNGTPYINLRRDDSTIAAADDIGYINFEGDDPSDGTFNTGARILAQAEGNWAADHYISSLIFQTRATCANLATVLTLASNKLATFAGNVNISGGNVQIGSGHNTASAGNAVVFASYGSGTNIAGGELQLYGGRSTGNAAGGSIKFYTSPAGSSGSGANSHVQALLIDSAQNSTFAGGMNLTGNFINVGNGQSNAENYIQLGNSRTGNGFAYVDFVGDTTYSDFGLRIIRNNSGANTSSDIIHRGTGNFNITTNDAASLRFQTSNTNALTIDSSQNATFAGKILVGTGATAAASLNAYTQTVSSNLFSALRVIENSGASSFWDIGATGGSNTLLNFYHNANTTAKISFTHTGGATFAGSVGAGITSPLGKIHTFSTSTNHDSNYGGNSFGVIVSQDNGNNAGDEGNGIVFTQQYAADGVDAGQVRTGAIIGHKVSATGSFGGGLKFKVQPAGANPLATALTISNDSSATFAGSVGIGETSLSGGNTTLDLKKTGTDVGTNIRFKNDYNSNLYIGISGDSSGNVIIYNQNNSDIVMYTGSSGTERMRITSAGDINILNATATDSKSIGITNAAGTTGWTFGNGVLSNTHQFVIYDNTAGSPRILIDSSGNVGIGTTLPRVIWHRAINIW
jgi:hypothetical protein